MASGAPPPPYSPPPPGFVTGPQGYPPTSQPGYPPYPNYQQPPYGNQPAYPPPTSSPQQQQHHVVVVSQAQPSTTYVIDSQGLCPHCRKGHIVEVWPTLCGVCWAIWCFPLGFICCMTMRERRCSHCGMAWL